MVWPLRLALKRFLVAWLVLLPLWLLLAGSADLDELAVGAAGAAIAAVAVDRVQLQKLARLAPLGRAFAQAWRLPRYAVTGTWEILVVLARHLTRRQPAPSLLFASPYSATGGDDASATLRALAIAYTTITPNFVVVDVDIARGLLLFHQLAASETPRMTRVLGARA